MNKVFLYLYPIEEYTKMFLFSSDSLYDERHIKRSLPILNECIAKRYRNKGYKIVYALYPDKELYGIIPKENDKIIYTDILFTDASVTDENGNKKENFIPKYPNEQKLINMLDNPDELVIGGYHAFDCVKRVGEVALNMGIATIIDLDLTDLFFDLYKKEDYFIIDEYSPERFKGYIIREAMVLGENFAKRQFERMYSSPAYGFNNDNDKIIKK